MSSSWRLPLIFSELGEGWDRRANDRVRINLAVKQLVKRELSLCQAGNVSSTGMLLARAHDSPYRGMPKCWLEFSLPGHAATIAARGQVVRQACRGRYHLMGVLFRSMPPSHRRLLRDYLSHEPEGDAELAPFERQDRRASPDAVCFGPGGAARRPSWGRRRGDLRGATRGLCESP